LEILLNGFLDCGLLDRKQIKMKTKSFKDYLESRLDKKEIAEIEAQVELEYQAIKNLQNDISIAISSYMVREKIGFNELVRRLDVSPSKLVKIQRGEANLTIASIAHISALLNRKARLVFE
jgi:transcriptional regulator with XRE-family HTH domain